MGEAQTAHAHAAVSSARAIQAADALDVQGSAPRAVETPSVRRMESELCGGHTGSADNLQALEAGGAAIMSGGVAAAAVVGPSQTGIGVLDFFTGGGSYMPRLHCLSTPEGKTDWPWVVAILVLSAGVIASYGKIFIFWMRSYFAEQVRDRNSKLFDLAIMFLLCATCGYAMSMLMFAWPGYRLLAILLVVLNVFSWKFCYNLAPFQVALAAKRLERELRETLESRAEELEKLVATRTAANDRLAQIAQRTTSAVIITDPLGRIEWVNAGFSRVTGYTLEEVVGKTPGSFLQGPKTDRAVTTRMSEAIRGGHAIGVELVNYTKSGTEYIVSVEIEPLCDAAGVLTGFMAIETDVTVQRAAEEGTRRAREMLARTSAMASVGGWELDVASGAVTWSDEVYRIHSVPLGTPMTVESVLALYPPGEREKKAEIFRAGIEESRFWDVELRRIDAAGNNMWLRSCGEAVWENGKAVRLRAAVQDITVQHVAQASAEAASRTKSEFLANMSHEIRTPLTAILGFADLLREDGDTSLAPSRRLETIDTIKNAGSHLLTIINDILDLSKIEADKMTVETVRTALVEVLCDVRGMMRQRAADKGVTLSVELGSPLPEFIMADPTRLRQILMNLVGNAAKFTERGGIVVRAKVGSESSMRLIVEVEDTGPGMTAEQAARLFAPFSQADSTVTRHHGGTGLGLTISRRLANLMGGDVTLVRTAVGEGSCFRLDVPLTASADARLITAIKPVAAVRPADVVANKALNGRILLAEDGKDNQRLLTFHLRKAGAEVDIADNGRIGLEMLEAAAARGAPYDVLLTDMQMPEMDGYTLARTLRSRGWTMPIIALTAHAMAEDRAKCVAAGCDDYASKPIDKTVLLATCAKWMQKRVAAA